MAEFVSAMWHSLPDGKVACAFKRCLILNDFHGAKEDIIWEEDSENSTSNGDDDE